MIEDNQKLVVSSLESEKGRRVISLGNPTVGRKDLICVKTGASYVVVGCQDGYLRILDTSGKKLHECACFDKNLEARFTDRSNTVHTAFVSPGSGVVAAGSEDGRVWVFDLDSGQRVTSWTAHSDRITSVAMSASGDWLASGSRDRLVRLWRRTAEGFEAYATLESPGAGPVRQILFDPDDKQIRVLHEREAGIRVWHLDRLVSDFRQAGLDR